MPKVSVILPVYNVEQFITETIKSVLSQTYRDFELLVVDDESPDQSIALVEAFSDSRIKIIHQKNRGLAGARNTGIRHARGEYLAFLDSDDLWLPTKLALHVAHLDAHPQVGVSFCRSAFIDEHSRPLGTYQIPKLDRMDPGYLLCRNPISNGSTPVIRAQVFRDIAFIDDLHGTPEECYFDEHFRQSEDVECWMRIVLQTPWQIAGIPEVLTLYRIHSGGLSAQVFKQLASWEKLIAKIRTYAPEFAATWEPVSRAYQLRYLARRAVNLKDGKVALELINQAVWSHWQIILEEPRRTLLTWGAALALWLLPASLYEGVRQLAFRITGANQRRRIEWESRRGRG